MQTHVSCILYDEFQNATLFRLYPKKFIENLNMHGNVLISSVNLVLVSFNNFKSLSSVINFTCGPINALKLF